jgi:DNA-binding CsgD family transcriptional regulator
MTIWSSGDSLPGPPNGRHWQSFADAIGLGNGSDLVMSLEPQGSVDRRLLMWRDTRKDFTEVDAALLTLVRPHREKMLQKRALETDSDLELTPRQQEVLRLASTGCSNAEIARLMVLSEGTVKKHLENIYSRLGVRNRAAAIAWVSDRGLA